MPEAPLRGDIVAAALPGDYGKPRPVLIVQSDTFLDCPSVTVLPLTSAIRDVDLTRQRVGPGPQNGLRLPSDVMIDKPVTIPRGKIGPRIGRLDAATLLEVDRRLAVFLGIAA
ncbi:type II toxin-antitoxin system PemK/MazF family toxin [Jannaschia sp. LMIT008]|uniref:type II toxin-antitoxin system PemK/MazF family toxin n=1 Tax=Jannaschia maritima TaxID=3032585 RepID=UPI00281255F9|nr:type II toxin-antitoxin system PemK/MazF family toxin [Jannaschia sp. LMIT008]